MLSLLLRLHLLLFALSLYLLVLEPPLHARYQDKMLRRECNRKLYMHRYFTHSEEGCTRETSKAWLKTVIEDDRANINEVVYYPDVECECEKQFPEYEVPKWRTIKTYEEALAAFIN